MIIPFFRPPPAARQSIFRITALLVALGLFVTARGAELVAPAAPAKNDFMPYIELTPFVVNGNQLAISIHARTKRDRSYAEGFATEVVKVVYEGVTESTGKGLVIIGQKGEPHPVFVFRKFLALAQAGKLDPVVAARGPELDSMLHHWQDTVNDEKSADSDSGTDMEFEKILTALPLPLAGFGAKLYQLAWAEGFDDAKVEAKFRSLHPADLEGSLFAHFDWVFYLPPRDAFDHVIDDLVAQALKEDNVGFFTRMMVKGVMLAVKPKIRQAIEGVRRGVLFETVVQARAGYGEAQVHELTGAYVETMMPDAKDSSSGTDHERAVKAVRAKLRTLEPKPADDPKSAVSTDQK